MPLARFAQDKFPRFLSPLVPDSVGSGVASLLTQFRGRGSSRHPRVSCEKEVTVSTSSPNFLSYDGPGFHFECSWERLHDSLQRRYHNKRPVFRRNSTGATRRGSMSSQLLQSESHLCLRQ